MSGSWVVVGGWREDDEGEESLVGACWMNEADDDLRQLDNSWLPTWRISYAHGCWRWTFTTSIVGGLLKVNIPQSTARPLATERSINQPLN